MVTDNADIDDVIRKMINDSFYVDDCLQSVSTESEAIQVVNELPSALAKGGFRLTKFVVNDDSVFSRVPECDKAKEVKHLTSELHNRVLGIGWNVDQDEFCYKANVKCDVVTKRTMLRVVASIYDPLGLVGPIIVAGA